MKISILASLFMLLFVAATLPNEEIRPTLFLCGDSTMANKQPIDAPETGWGMILPEYFTDALKIQNHAVNGRSTKSFRTLGHWKGVIDQVKAGDYVLLQFGHNDSKESDTLRYAAPQTDYRKNLTRFIEEIRAKGANPILATPIMRRKFDAKGNFIDQHGEYPSVVRDLAAKLNVPLLDMHKKSQKIIEANGIEGSKKMFMNFGAGFYIKHPKGIVDDTHTSHYGAELMATSAVECLFDISHPLKYFVKKSAFEEKYSYELPKIAQPFFRNDSFSIIRYGAKVGTATPENIAANTKAINQAIDMANQAGGGIVEIPSGMWSTGCIVLKSGVNLHLNRGALVIFSPNHEDFPLVLATYEGVETFRCQSPISATDAENIAITGEGIFDGNGHTWRMLKKSKVNAAEWKKITSQKGGIFSSEPLAMSNEPSRDSSKLKAQSSKLSDTWFPSESFMKGNAEATAGFAKTKMEDCLTIKDFLRPNMVVLTRCKQVLLENVTFQNSPAWTMHPLLCENLTIKNVSSKAPSYAQNSDALDAESCKNVLIEGCTFEVGDDGITLKSGRDEFGRKRGVPTENVIIKDCKVYQAHGGFVIGSEMSGGVKNIFVSNCTFMGSDIGLRFKTARGRGGVVENIYISDITMNDIPNEAILFDMYYNGKEAAEALKNPTANIQPVTEATPQFQNFFIRNIICNGAEQGIMIQGLPESNVKNVLIENSIFQTKHSYTFLNADGVRLINTQFINEMKEEPKVINSKNVKVNGL